MRLSFAIFFLLLTMCAGYAQEPGKPLPPWREGMLDLHHINTGRGDAAFYIFPDGTTMLLDAGEMPPASSPRRTALQPDASKTAHEWIVYYIRKFAPRERRVRIDYALLTHFHDDHFGGYYPEAPASRTGKYLRTGITGVGDEIPIGKLLDRGFPSYSYPADLKQLRVAYLSAPDAAVSPAGQTMVNYWNFIRHQVQHNGMQAEGVRAGRSDQIALMHAPGKFENFQVRNIKSNGSIWTGKGTETFEQFIPYTDDVMLAENPLSNVIRIDYGNFRYYSGGDCPSIADLGQPAWNDVGTPVARAVGAVDVAVMDHHGNRDAHNEFNVKTLRPRVWVQQTWSSDHPGHEVLRRVTSEYLYPGPRDLFATNMMEANKIVIGPALERAYKSMDGHILVRVMPGGKEYYVIILNDDQPAFEVKSVHGPYAVEKK